MIDNKLKTQVKKYMQVHYSFEWGMKLLEESGDNENLKMIQELRKSYKTKAFDLMRENNINQIKIDVARNSTITLTINKNKF